MPSSRQLAAIMFTDIVGYTALMGRDEQKAFELLNKNRQIQKPIIEEFNGRWIKELGDGVLASFNTVSDAVTAAIKILEACNASRDFQLRIGVHLGEVVFENDDMFGDGVNIASRIQNIALPGRIYISDAVYHNISNKRHILAKFIKTYTLKNVKEPLGIYEVIIDALEENFISDSKTQNKAENSIVVLPFVNMSNDSDQEYFSDGLTEEIISDLSQIEKLRVISRTSAMTFKGSNKNIKEIATEVGVKYVLEGSVRKFGNNLRIVAQLLDAEQDEHLWSKKYDGNLDDIFAIQEQVSRLIADTLKIKLSQEESKLLGTNPIKDPRAYDLYKKAQFEFFRFKEDGLNRAVKYLDDALKIEGENTLLYARLGLTYTNLLNISDKVESFYLEKAKFFASRVFDLNSNSSSGYLLLGFIAFWDGDLREAVSHLTKALAANPNDPDILCVLILGYFYTGLSGEALRASNNLSSIDPLNPIYYVLRSLIHYSNGEISAAYHDTKSAYEIYPEVPQNQLYYAYFLACMQNFEEASTILDRLINENTYTIFRPLGLILKSAFSNTEFQDSVLTEEIEAKLKMDCEWSWLVADAYSLMNAKEKAIDWLEYILHRGFINYPLLSNHDPFLKNVRNEKRFQKLIDLTKHEWEKTKAEYE